MENNLFQFNKSVRNVEKVEATYRGYWSGVFQTFMKNKAAVISLFLLLAIFLVAAIGPFLIPHNAYEQHSDMINQGPTNAFLFGYDYLGRDIFVRICNGVLLSLALAIVTVVINSVFGIAYGSVAGFFGGRVDDVMRSFYEIIVNIPDLVILSVLLLVIPPGFVSLVVAFSVTYWIGIARLMRGLVFKYRELEFIMASKTLGNSNFKILFKHIIPNVLGNIALAITLMIPSVIFYEAFLSFIGLGFPLPTPTLGNMLSTGVQGFSEHPHTVIFPAVVMSILMISITFLANGLRDALDPQMHSR